MAYLQNIVLFVWVADKCFTYLRNVINKLISPPCVNSYKVVNKAGAYYYSHPHKMIKRQL